MNKNQARLLRFERGFQSVAQVVLATLILVAGLEGTARIWYFFREPKPPVHETNTVAATPVSQNAAYDSEDVDAFDAQSATLPKKLEWRPYVYWRRPVYEAPDIQVDERGVRRTIQPFDATAKTKIWMFGGSTMWGTGVLDRHTLPSLLAARLQREGVRDFHVTNFGETAYVATQSLLTLLLQLRQGNVPSVVIFYEGVNEVASSYIQHEAGMTQHEGEIGFYENAPKRVEELSFWKLVLMKSAVMKGLHNLVHRGKTELANDSPVHRAPVPSDDVLAEQTVSNYYGVLALVQALADQYGFEAYFFYQPSEFSKKPLAPIESKDLAGLDQTMWKTFQPLFDKVNERIAAKPPSRVNFQDLQTALNGHTGPLFTDIFHLTEKGNALIADRLVERILRTSRQLHRTIGR